MNPSLPFVLLTTHRSGSSVLWRTLDQTPTIWVKGELVRDGAVSQHSYTQLLERSRWHRLIHGLAPGAGMRRFLDQTLGPRKGRDAVGFKLMYDQITPTVRGWFDAHAQVHYVHLIRDNHLKTQISIAGARARDRYAVRSDQDFEFEPIQLPTESLLQDLEASDRRIDEHRHWIAERPHLEIHYEDFQVSPEAVVAAVQSFLGVETTASAEAAGGAHEKALPLKKMTPEAPSEALSNYAEVADLLAGTPYERFLT